ncbi:MPK5, partial [Symbiodinium sp. CCMP2456]
MYTQVRKMLQFKNVHGSAVKDEGTKFPSRILFRRTDASDLQAAERLYNEYLFLLSWRNENFVVVQDLFVAPAASGGCWYCIFDYMETSMAAVLRSPMHLTANHVDYFSYNILRGLRFLHSLGYAHGSVCPSNVWLNANDDIQLSHLCYMHPADVPIAAEASAE